MNILTVSDNPLSTSGVAQQMKLIIDILEPNNKIISLSINETKPVQVTQNWGVIYGGKSEKEKQNILLQILENEKIDYILFMTDPRFFTWIMPIEYKMKALCNNIIYYHVWDSYPAPTFNKGFYDVFTHIACISKLTYSNLREMGYKNISYVPHTLPKEIYQIPLEQRPRISPKFTVLWDSRNMFRKSPACAIEAFSIFHKKHPNSFLIMKTDPILAEGCDITYVLSHYGLTENDCLLIGAKMSLKEMNDLYNAVDLVLNTSLAEGFGLSALMGLKTGKMVIAPQIGGLQDQVDNKVGFCVKPDFSYNFASMAAPIIYFEFVKPQTYAKFLEQAFYFSPERRDQFGKNAIKKYNEIFSNEIFENNWKNIFVEDYAKRQSEFKNFVNIRVI